MEPGRPNSDSCKAAGLRRGRKVRGFTLIEATLATVIIGVGVLSMMTLFGTSTTQNAAAGEMTTALLLANNVQEALAGLSFSDPTAGRLYYGPEPGESLETYDDLDDFHGLTFNPPIDSLRRPVGDLTQYSQVVTVAPTYANKLSSNQDLTNPEIPVTTYTGAVRITVRVLYRATSADPSVEVYRNSWIRVDD